MHFVHKLLTTRDDYSCQVKDYNMCFHNVLKYQAKNNIRYDMLARLRFDVAYA